MYPHSITVGTLNTAEDLYKQAKNQLINTPNGENLMHIITKELDAITKIKSIINKYDEEPIKSDDLTTLDELAKYYNNQIIKHKDSKNVFSGLLCNLCNTNLKLINNLKNIQPNFKDITTNIPPEELIQKLTFEKNKLNTQLETIKLITIPQNKTLNKITATWIESIEDQLKQIEILSSIIQQFNDVESKDYDNNDIKSIIRTLDTILTQCDKITIESMKLLCIKYISDIYKLKAKIYLTTAKSTNKVNLAKKMHTNASTAYFLYLKQQITSQKLNDDDGINSYIGYNP